MDRLLFGTGGTPHSAKTGATVDGIRRIAELRLGAMEIEFVQGVKMGEATARQVAEVASSYGIELSAHAPYFINLNAREPEKIRASQERLLQTARIASACGEKSVVCHTAFYLGDPPAEVYPRVKGYLEEVMSRLRRESNQIWLRPEVMGKPTQFGTTEEVLNLSRELDGVAPCLDLAHWHARSGRFNSYPEFTSLLLQFRERLGRAALDNMHIHLSGISYGRSGEIKHLNLKESDLQYVALLQALRDDEVKGVVICESPNLEEDALLLQASYNSLTKVA